jgi:hypothetical protein
MATAKTELGKYIWFIDHKWEVLSVMRPTPYKTYLLVSRKSKRTVHDDGTPVVHIITIDIKNDLFMPDTPRAKKIVQERKRISGRIRELSEKESDIWLDTIKTI